MITPQIYFLCLCLTQPASFCWRPTAPRTPTQFYISFSSPWLTMHQDSVSLSTIWLSIRWGLLRKAEEMSDLMKKQGFSTLCVQGLSESFVIHRSLAWPLPLASVDSSFWTLCWNCVQPLTMEFKATLDVHDFVMHVCMIKGYVCSMSVQGVKHTYI